MSKLSIDELKEFLDAKVYQFNKPSFIEDDPISIPHAFERKEDIEIVALIVSTIAWGKRELIIRSGNKLIELLGDSPYEFVLQYNGEIESLKDFKHRTFNAIDLDFFLRSLRNIYENEGLEACFKPHSQSPGALGRIVSFRERFLQIEHEKRSEKHLSNPLKKSAAKRLNMFLRWMCRKDDGGVDFGLWQSIPSSELYLPLDVHTGNMARKMGILSRKQNDVVALEEIMETLRKLDPVDPVKYDFALFGLGVYEEF